MRQISIEVDVYIDNYVDDVSDKALLDEFASRARKPIFLDQMRKHFETKVPLEDGIQRSVDRLAEEIACGDIANALDTLRSIFPSVRIHDAIGFARRSCQGRHAS